METTIILTDTEAELFKKFMKYRELFITMELTGVLDIQYGKATFNFAAGVLQNIQRDEIVWKR